MSTLRALGLLALALGLGAPAAQPSAGGDAQRGKELIHRYGCGACHEIPGIPGARGHVGPPLTAMARRAYIAGALPNVPGNLRHWIVDPQAVEPGTAMPNLGVPEADAADIAAYLYTLR